MDPQIIISPPSAPKSPLKKDILAAIVVGIVLLSIPLGVYLVQQKQIFKPKASGELPAGPETSFSLTSAYSQIDCTSDGGCLDHVVLLPVGQVFKVQVLVRSDIEAANAFAASIKFPKDLLEVTNLWTGSGSIISCSGLSDNSCPSNYSCALDCGPPVVNAAQASPSTYSCVPNSSLVGGQRNCPICLAEDTQISTPYGETSVQNIKQGMLVYSVNSKGQKITSKVLKTSIVQVPPTHQMIQLRLKDGKILYVSPGHPISNGQTSDQLQVGDKYSSSVVVGVERVKYWADKTYDLLPDSQTGYYFANGILMGSTLKGQVKGISTVYAQSGSGQICAQVVTHACAENASFVGADGLKCKDFPSPCDVPTGWFPADASGNPIVKPTPGSTANDLITIQNNYFIQKWITKTYDNNAGTISLVGGVPNPGFQTQGQGAVMATIEFRAKAPGAANITFGDDSTILSNSTNQNILTVKRDTTINIAPGAKKKGDGNGDGKIDLVDLSILLSNYGKNKPELDYNDDGVINGLDYTAMVKFLLDSGVIKQLPVPQPS